MHRLNRYFSTSLLTLTVASGLIGTMSASLPARAISDEELGLPYGQATGLPRGDVRLTAARIIMVALQLLGVIALAIVVYAGFIWMTAGGNEEKITEAKKWLYAGIIGLALILSAYSIASFVIGALISATQGSGYYN